MEDLHEVISMSNSESKYIVSLGRGAGALFVSKVAIERIGSCFSFMLHLLSLGCQVFISRPKLPSNSSESRVHWGRNSA